MRFLIISVFLILVSHNILAQIPDSATILKISRKLINQELQPYLEDDNIEQQGDCIYGKEEEFTLSCISANCQKECIGDMDGDGFDDIVFQVVDEGMGGGGNAFCYDFKLVMLKEGFEIKQIYSLIGGSKMSYTNLSVDEIKEGKLYATLKQNPYGYGFDGVTFDNADSLKLIFFWDNGQIHESHYNNCAIGQMDKNIFRRDVNFQVNRQLKLNNSYNEEQEELLYLPNKDYYNATLTGCDNIEMSFEFFYAKKQTNTISDVELPKILLKHFNFLAENTRYKSVFTLLKDKISCSGKMDYSINAELENGWKAIIYLTPQKDSQRLFIISLIKTSTNEATFWDEMKKKINTSN